MKQELLAELVSVKLFFERSTSCLQEEHSSFTPAEGMLSVAHQVAHAAQSIDWFMEGIDNPSGFDMNFESHWTHVRPCTSLSEAREWFTKSVAAASEKIESMSDEDLALPLAEGPVMGGQPRYAVLGAISEHTAHHRGALSVYSRLLGLEPRMPYM